MPLPVFKKGINCFSDFRMEDFAPGNALNRGSANSALENAGYLSDTSMETTTTTDGPAEAQPKMEIDSISGGDSKNLPQPTLLYKSNPKFPQVELCKDFRDRDQLTDVTVKVGDKEIRAHKLILAATIPYFQSMFCSGMVEVKKEGE